MHHPGDWEEPFFPSLLKAGKMGVYRNRLMIPSWDWRRGYGTCPGTEELSSPDHLEFSKEL
ncbi:MAG: hypothetical protein A2Z73_00865 [Deltaproteobacteria bacterium RBG_13_60_28]|nr:MAG: hypothetical protein A2Z73_00865 [Deltaproteobacteria bacterium RBG_13_60_28]